MAEMTMNAGANGRDSPSFPPFPFKGHLTGDITVKGDYEGVSK